MSFFVVSVQPRRERHFMRSAELRRRHVALDPEPTLYWPRRKLTIRRRGKRQETLAPIFPGYVFLSADRVTDEMFRFVRELPGFYRFLDSNDRIRALSGRDSEIVTHFVKFGDVIGKSTVTFDKNQRIRVLNGPLEGLEGAIVKVDKRKQRAKVRLDLYNESFLVDFGFELLGKSVDGPGEGS